MYFTEAMVVRALQQIYLIREKLEALHPFVRFHPTYFWFSELIIRGSPLLVREISITMRIRIPCGVLS